MLENEKPMPMQNTQNMQAYGTNTVLKEILKVYLFDNYCAISQDAYERFFGPAEKERIISYGNEKLIAVSKKDIDSILANNPNIEAEYIKVRQPEKNMQQPNLKKAYDDDLLNSNLKNEYMDESTILNDFDRINEYQNKYNNQKR